MMLLTRLLATLPLLLLPGFATASTGGSGGTPFDLTTHFVGLFALMLFIAAYILVALEEVTALRKSKPVLLAAGMIWIAIAMVYAGTDLNHLPAEQARHNLLEYAELALFLLVAMTYVNAMEERAVFKSLRAWMLAQGFSLRQIFWLTGLLSFVISPVADNLTTALLMCAVIMAVGGENKKFIAIGCVNIVVAANAGGAFSPFGDITTLMVWQKGKVTFWEFFVLFIPALINWLIPAAIMHFAVTKGQPDAVDETVLLKRGALPIVGLFLLTIMTAVIFHNYLHLPPVLGMFTGLAYLQFYGYYLKRTFNKDKVIQKYQMTEDELYRNQRIGTMVPFDIFTKVSRSEWDTLLFFYGVVMCVGGLGFIGYLSMTSELMYDVWGPTYANIAVGVLSALVDNIPVMFAVLTMDPTMSHGQWLLVTLTAGVGGSMLSIGSAAGVALMGQSHGIYTFGSHLKWTPVIALGYAASVAAHMVINKALF
ncbi:MAG: Na+/H+ antiporter NhaD type [uncultured Thiotrichaceae bacterium]|uniref:Na+/H+ antiporter NhaD type n=1 Tax=uncultured Thiotrichaceae bacterium TaxID=298394 RepID=A0A6S6U143_9GAMM|nr:MAG: Na+/H+ antiporter NhaD type [uncultured Thiotrichaceae bacterium]